MRFICKPRGKLIGRNLARRRTCSRHKRNWLKGVMAVLCPPPGIPWFALKVRRP